MLSNINSGDTAWTLLCAALTLLLIPGYALFYGGISRGKAWQSLLMLGLSGAGVILLQWLLVGYSIAFGPDRNGWIGTLARAGLRGVGPGPNLEYAGTIPELAFLLHRGVMATIPAVLIMSAFATRIRLSAFCAFIILWTSMVYDP